MNDAALVAGGKAACDLHRKVDGLPHRQWFAVQPLTKGLPVEQLGDDERGALVQTEIVDCDDVRVAQAGGRASLPFEPTLLVRIARPAGPQYLDRDFALELGIARTIHLAHAAGTQRAQNLESAEAIAH